MIKKIGAHLCTIYTFHSLPSTDVTIFTPSLSNITCQLLHTITCSWTHRTKI